MTQTRREWLAGATGAIAGLALNHKPVRAESKPARSGPFMPRIGMCDWSLARLDPSVFELAGEIGLDGVQVSIGDADNRLWLRQPKVQQQYLEASRKSGLAIPSLAMGLLNHVPLMSEPRAALWVADAIAVAKAMQVRSILLAFFSNGELREKDTDNMRRVIEVLQELAPRAEKAGVVLGVESYLSAEAHLKILEQVKSDAVQVYYDIFNSHVTRGYDFVKELRLIGGKRICEIHFKEGGNFLGGSGKIDWPAAVAVIREIGYDKWIVLETSSPTGNMVEDTRKNLRYVKELFGHSSAS